MNERTIKEAREALAALEKYIAESLAEYELTYGATIERIDVRERIISYDGKSVAYHVKIDALL